MLHIHTELKILPGSISQITESLDSQGVGESIQMDLASVAENN